jgi:CheY-like chemotaxis protein
MKKQESHKSETHASGGTRKPGAARKPVTVLHVDDNPNDTTLLQVACAKADVNFELQNIGDGDQVIDYLSGAGQYADRSRFRLPSLVLLDLKMPRVEGFTVLKWIRNQSSLKHLPVIVLSGSEMKEDVREALAMGANSYLVKPISFDSLIALAREIGTHLPRAGL